MRNVNMTKQAFTFVSIIHVVDVWCWRRKSILWCGNPNVEDWVMVIWISETGGVLGVIYFGCLHGGEPHYTQRDNDSMDGKGRKIGEGNLCLVWPATSLINWVHAHFEVVGKCTVPESWESYGFFLLDYGIFGNKV